MTATLRKTSSKNTELINTVLNVFWKVIDSALKDYNLDNINLKHLSNTQFSIFDISFELVSKSIEENNSLKIIIEANCLEEHKMLTLSDDKKYKLASFTNLMRTVFNRLCENAL